MQELLGVFIGLGLSATCGFRVFIPLLGMSIAHQAGHLTLAPGFQWIGSWPSLVAFGIAMVIEIIGYYTPWVDNILDTIATPLSGLRSITAAYIIKGNSFVPGLTSILR